MIKLLAKLFIKDSKNYKDNDVRQKYGMLCGFAGVILNLLLCILKFIFGTLAASVAMVADAFNNLSDAASSVVQILGFKLASKEPDREHPFGHGRIEYIAGLIISFFILYMGLELVRRSIKSIINPEEIHFSLVSLIILLLAIVIKVYIFFYNHNIGKKIESVAMEATAKDSLSDVIVTSVVVLSIVAAPFTSFPVDSIGGIIVGLCILKNGIESLKDTISPLLGQGATQEFVNQLEEVALSHKPISEIHDVVLHDYGPGRRVVTLHAEVPGNVDIFQLHDAIDAAEDDIAHKFNCQILIHMDPVDVENEDLSKIKEIVNEEASKIDTGIQVHDIRIVATSSGRKLFFELRKPANLKIKNEDLKTKMYNAVQSKVPAYECVVKEINDAYL
ncbi:MAG: cation transporter [Treponema sp.]|nr:cation transporter [Treponema sp.]